jgi:hypothetical protein
MHREVLANHTGGSTMWTRLAKWFQKLILTANAGNQLSSYPARSVPRGDWHPGRSVAPRHYDSQLPIDPLWRP